MASRNSDQDVVKNQSMPDAQFMTQQVNLGRPRKSEEEPRSLKEKDSLMRATEGRAKAA
jgi:hypothetical protein